MALSIDWTSFVIAVPQAYLTFISTGLYELDVDAFRLDLKDIEDSEEGMPFPDTHRHNTEVVLSGVTYARTFEILSPYTVTFEDTGTPYTVRCVGANHNIADIKNVNNVSLIIGNSAGLISVDSGGGGFTSTHAAQLLNLYERLGLDPAKPLTTNTNAGTIVAGSVSQTIDESTPGVVIVTRQP